MPDRFLPSIPVRLLASVLVMCAAAAPTPAQPSPGDGEPPLVLGEIIVTGNTKTDIAVVMRLMDLEIGQPFSLEVMDAAWDALEDSGHFQFVDMEDEETDDGKVILTVDVEEDISTYYGPLIRPEERHKYLLGAWLEERNLRGKAESLRLEAAPVYPQTARASWHRPWLAGVRGLEAELSVAGEQADFVFRPTRYRKWDTGLDLRWRFAGPLFFVAGAGYGHFLQRDIYDWNLPDRGPGSPTGSATYPVSGENHWRLDIGVGLDTRNNPYYPNQGEYLLARVRRWESNGFSGYTETSLDARLFVTLPRWQHVLGLHAWGRRVDGPAQLDNQLFFGGAHAIRGYAFGTLTGDEGWLLSTEYRLPLFYMPISPQGEAIGFGLHLFADAGATWYEGDDPGRPAQGWGGGVHVILDALQLRFEEARTRDGEWRFQFMNGFQF